MKITALQLQELKSPQLVFVGGSLDAEGYRPWPPEIAPPGSVVYVSKVGQMQAAIEAPAGVIVALEEILSGTPQLAPGQALFRTPRMSAAMALINPLFETRKSQWTAGVSPLASVDPTALISANVSVGPFAVIGPAAKIGEGTRIGPHCVIEAGANIGAHTVLHPFVYIGESCELGQECEIYPHTTIGADGFGYDTDRRTGLHTKIPQLGKVVLGDRVSIGANCTIDRATLHQTEIGSGSKLDDHCHVAHNCKIGKNAVLAGGVMIAGSTQIGDSFTSGGVVTISDHLNITDHVTVGGLSGITGNVTEPGVYVGYPLEPYRKGLRTLTSLAAVPEMRKQLRELLKAKG